MNIEWFILLLTTVATCEGALSTLLQRICYNERPALDAPVYSPGTENLSYEKCGLWDGNGDMPWTVIITIEGQDWNTSAGWIPDDLKSFQEFYGFLITEETVLVFRNPMDIEIIENYRLYAGPCDSGSNEGNCKFGRGLLNQKVQSRNVVGDALEVWKIENVTITQYLKPICLWNSNNLQDSSYDSFVFTQADRKLKTATLLPRAPLARCSMDWKRGRIRNRYTVYRILPKLDNMQSTDYKDSEFGAKESYEGCGKVDWERRGGRQRRDGLPIPYVHHGTNAPIEENPWHVSLTINMPTTDTLYDACGGTLVSKRVIVTAAHCMYGPTGTRYEPEWLEITLGMYDVRDNTENGRQIVQAASVVIHPGYNNDRKDWQHDLALIILDEKGNNSIQLSDRVKPVCLWNSDYDFDKIVGKDGKVTGFGLTKDYLQATILQKAFLRIVSHNECFFSNKRFFSKHLRPTQNFCAGYPLTGTNVCVGDSGGGLLIGDATSISDKRFYLRGVVSFGPSRTMEINNDTKHVCNTNQFSLFVDITSYIEWIVQNSPDISLRHGIGLNGMKKIVALMAPIPKLATKIEFGAEESYEGCGKVTWTRRRGRRRRDDLPISLMHHGTNAPIEENPWHVSLTINFPTTDPLFDICGGTLVSKRVIVTAAHCMFSPTTGTRYEMEWLEITLGMYDVGDNTENGRQIVQAASVVIHPKYNNDRKDFQHDLALIILDEHGNNSIHLSDRVRPACLWNSDYDIEKIAGQDGKVVGFGLTANYSQATILQKAFIRIESHNECFFSNKRFFSKHLRPTQNFCAGFPHNGTNVCGGDSGGGLLIANGTSISDKRFYLRGVVSFGPSRMGKIDNVDQRVCDTNQFSLFVDITRYIKWIVQNSPDISLRR
ncbi:transmembrane protease serine 9-like isoform X3 [Cloeon dipterum]|uniref:transmembrane protease serine 9-like isoform X3 n=1 Tax=Cloeon dipterum TaxID=197152 RepID=UPI00321F8CF7